MVIGFGANQISPNGRMIEVEACVNCGKTEKVKSYKGLPNYLGWYELSESKTYCDPCIALERERAIEELKESFSGSKRS